MSKVKSPRSYSPTVGVVISSKIVPEVPQEDKLSLRIRCLLGRHLPPNIPWLLPTLGFPERLRAGVVSWKAREGTGEGHLNPQRLGKRWWSRSVCDKGKERQRNNARGQHSLLVLPFDLAFLVPTQNTFWVWVFLYHEISEAKEDAWACSAHSAWNWTKRFKPQLEI